MKKTVYLLVGLSLLIGVGRLSKVEAKEKGQVLIINQVRGRECCGKGSEEVLENQLRAMERLGLEGFWLLRYDALGDEELTGLIKEYWKKGVVKPGILVEVVPSLVGEEVYEEKRGEWYEARKVFSLGYERKIREKMMDRLQERFKSQFGTYARIGGAWMIDGYSLDYLQEEYGLEVFEITREQWGTDTYKLYGGGHYPYLASKKWPLIPNEEQGGVWVVRQTISDPLYNYGDVSSGYTSQPNDYLQAGRGSDYFRALFDQAVVDNKPGWGVLGLENSMGESFEKEFEKQLEYVSRKQEEGEVGVVGDLGQLEKWREEKVRIYQGRDLLGRNEEMVWWVESDKYRLRVRSNGEEIYIDDLRVYLDWEDPYWKEVVETEGVWVVPFLVDGSRWYEQKEENVWWRGWWGPPKVERVFKEVERDVGSEPMRIILGEVRGKVEIKDESLWWAGGKKGLMFGEEGWKSRGIEGERVQFVQEGEDDNYPVKEIVDEEGVDFGLQWMVDGEVSHWLRMKEGEWRVGGDGKQWAKMLESQYPYGWPEPRKRGVSGEKSVIYVHNRVAVAGRNPVRLVALLYDSKGLGVVREEPLEIEVEGEGVETNLSSQRKRQVQLIDLFSKEAQKRKVKVRLGERVVEKQVWWAPNCKKELGYCLSHPRKAWWYVRGVGGDWLRRELLGESQ